MAMGSVGRAAPRALSLGLAVLAATGCATLTPAQQTSLDEVHAFVATAAKAYQVPPLRVLTGDTYTGLGGQYRPGLLIISNTLLLNSHRDKVVAHELAHYLLGHDVSRILSRQLSQPTSIEDWGRMQQPLEMDANAKGVEILARVRMWSERTALIFFLEYMQGAAVAQRRGYPRPTGHAPACEEIADLRSRFPAHAEATARFAC
jgi:hypothetical protein